MMKKDGISIAVLYICMLTLTGCDIKDDFMDNCYMPYSLCVVESEDADDGFNIAPFASNDISLMLEPHEVLIYIFSKDLVFLGSHRTTVNEIVQLPYGNYDQLYIATVATDKGVDIESLFSTFEQGKTYKKSDLLFELSPVIGKTNLDQSPVDFMYASDDFNINPYNDRNIIYYLYLEPRIGAVKVVTHGIKEWADKTFGKTGLDQDEFTFVVGTTADRYDISGTLFGNQVSYQPSTLYYNSGDVNTPMFNLMPTRDNKGVIISIYRNGTLIYPHTDIQKKISYTVPPRTPYIISLNFNASQDDAGIEIIPSEFSEIVINITF